MKKIVCLALTVALLAECLWLNSVCVEANLNPKKEGSVTKWDCFEFGTYPQSSNGYGGFRTEPIKWRVLKQFSNGSLRLISDKIIDCVPYHYTWEKTTWERCDLRSFLNNGFYFRAFSGQERNYIITTNVGSEKNPQSSSSTTYGNKTQDKVYLLGYSSASKNEYGFEAADIHSNTRTCNATAYAYSSGLPKTNGWLLRSPGLSNDMVTFSCGGLIFTLGVAVQTKDFAGVRPVINVKYNQKLYDSYAGQVWSNGKVINPPDAVDYIYGYNKKKRKVKLLWDKAKGAAWYRVQYSRKK